LNKIFDGISLKVAALKGVKKFLVNKGIKSKLEKYKKTGKVTNWLYDMTAFKPFRSALGGRV